MSNEAFDQKAWLARIGCDGPLTPPRPSRTTQPDRVHKSPHADGGGLKLTRA